MFRRRSPSAAVVVARGPRRRTVRLRLVVGRRRRQTRQRSAAVDHRYAARRRLYNYVEFIVILMIIALLKAHQPRAPRDRQLHDQRPSNADRQVSPTSDPTEQAPRQGSSYPVMVTISVFCRNSGAKFYGQMSFLTPTPLWVSSCQGVLADIRQGRNSLRCIPMF